MTTQCTQLSFGFHPLHSREVVAKFDGGKITSDGGALLLRETEQRTAILRQFASCFIDHRNPDKIEHTVAELVSQRVYGITLGYEDLNDHDQLRHDPLLGVLAGKADPTGNDRARARDRGKSVAGKSTLNRLELTPENSDAKARYKKIVMKETAVDKLLVDLYIQRQARQPEEIVLDLDATDDPLHGQQEGRFFHGYYGGYCYLPLYIFCGSVLLCARLRPSNIDAAKGALEEVQRIVAQLRQKWPQVRVTLRADSGFCREEIMKWCEAESVEYVFGLARNQRLAKIIGGELQQAKQEQARTGKAARVFREFAYQTRKTWSKARRVIGKAEHLEKGPNPRFIVTSAGMAGMEARALYEDFYCARGEMENRIKEQQLGLFADRTSTSLMRSNQLRLYFSSIAYCLMEALRALGLKGTEMEQAQCTTIRERLLKIGAQVKVSARRVYLAMAEGYPWQGLYQQIWEHLRQVAVPAN